MRYFIVVARNSRCFFKKKTLLVFYFVEDVAPQTLTLLLSFCKPATEARSTSTCPRLLPDRNIWRSGSFGCPALWLTKINLYHFSLWQFKILGWETYEYVLSTLSILQKRKITEDHYTERTAVTIFIKLLYNFRKNWSQWEFL